MQVNQDMAVRMRTKITRISPSRRLTVPASLRPSSVYFCFCACDLIDVAKDCARFQWQSDFNLEMTHYLERVPGGRQGQGHHQVVGRPF